MAKLMDVHTPCCYSHQKQVRWPQWGKTTALRHRLDLMYLLHLKTKQLLWVVIGLPMLFWLLLEPLKWYFVVIVWMQQLLAIDPTIIDIGCSKVSQIDILLVEVEWFFLYNADDLWRWHTHDIKPDIHSIIPLGRYMFSYPFILAYASAVAPIEPEQTRFLLALTGEGQGCWAGEGII